MDWATRIMTISLEMVLPGLVGYWLDTKLGTKALFMLAGFALGSLVAMKQLLSMTRPSKLQLQDKVSEKEISEPAIPETENGKPGVESRKDQV